MNKYKNILLSFVGTNDAGGLYGKSDGAILTALEYYKKNKFDAIYLFWTSSKKQNIDYDKISQYIEYEISKRKLCREVKRVYFDINNVTDHNEIYPKLLNYLKLNLNSSSNRITAAIASGTPSIQACWILVAESGDFKLELIRSNEPEFGLPAVVTVKLDTSLPRIMRLQEENIKLKRINKDLLPFAKLSIVNSELYIGEIFIPLSPLQFCYYRYFLERIHKNEGDLKLKGYEMPREFCERIITFYEDSYKDHNLNIKDYKTKLSKFEYIQASIFRSHLSKLNSRIKKELNNSLIYNYFKVHGIGSNQSKSYGINIPKEKIRLVK